MVLRKVSELKYAIVSNSDKKQIVHVNRLKKCYNQSLWNPKGSQKITKKFQKGKRNAEIRRKARKKNLE